MFDASLSTKPVPGRRETVTLLAALMALNAIAIDAMLPALPAIGQALGIANDNDRQLVIIVYMLGFGAGQLVWGPLGDRFGRKRILALGVGLYALFALACGLASSFPMLLAARAAMGASAAVTRVLVLAMVRDLFEGPAMARVMSLIFMVFMVVPVLAPSIGQAILLVGEWHLIFLMLGAYAALVGLWAMLRLPETMHPEFRRTLKVRDMAEAARQVVADRLSRGYTLASTLLFGALSAYIASIQQIVADVFHAGGQLGLVFAGIAAPMSAAAYANSRLVTRFGLRHVGHLGLLAFVAVSTVHAALSLVATESLPTFILFQAAMMISFAFCSSNFGTLAMTNMAPIAGTASSVQGVSSTIGGALLGWLIGSRFDGTVVPFLVGMALCGIASLGVVLLTEGGALFRERPCRVDPLPECNP